jgi:hypothetical protein
MSFKGFRVNKETIEIEVSLFIQNTHIHSKDDERHNLTHAAFYWTV